MTRKKKIAIAIAVGLTALATIAAVAYVRSRKHAAHLTVPPPEPERIIADAIKTYETKAADTVVELKPKKPKRKPGPKPAAPVPPAPIEVPERIRLIAFRLAGGHPTSLFQFAQTGVLHDELERKQAIKILRTHMARIKRHLARTPVGHPEHGRLAGEPQRIIDLYRFIKNLPLTPRRQSDVA